MNTPGRPRARRPGRVLLDARTSLRSQAERLLARVRRVEGLVDLAETVRWEVDDSSRP